MGQVRVVKERKSLTECPREDNERIHPAWYNNPPGSPLMVMTIQDAPSSPFQIANAMKGPPLDRWRTSYTGLLRNDKHAP